jgi:outer membrane protein TolC
MMRVKRRSHSAFAPVFCFLFLAGAAAALGQNPTSADNPFYGSVTGHPATDETIQLSLDEAVRRGLENNLGLREAESGVKTLQGERDQALQEFLPTVTFVADTGFYQHNLAALGFTPSVIARFATLLPGGPPAGFSTITRDTLTEGLLHMDWTLFSGPVLAGWRAAGAAQRSAHYAMMTARGDTIQTIADTYLRAVADASEVDNARANVAQAQVFLNDAHAAHQAGTVANLEELRAKVELQSRRQSLIAAQNALDKHLILLKREIGLDPGQNIVLTDGSPYDQLSAQTLPELLATANQDRQDLQNLRNQSTGFKAIHAAYRSRRWPTLSFSAFYGTQTITTVGTHGVFTAMGTLKVPIFREAGIRGGEDSSEAQLEAVDAQLADLRQQIEEQLRDALLDVAASRQLVDVARSNVELATRALGDESLRVKAGVDTNLPLVTAQAALASAKSSLVESIYHYNLSKLGLARAAGVLELQYRAYLGQQTP